MSNMLNNGAVLPSGLLSAESISAMDGFKKTYQNTAIKMGIIMECYPIKSPKNVSRLAPEYDVLVFEQNEDKGATPITYRNCLSVSSLGSIADFLDVKLRKMKAKKTKGSTPSPSGQNGAIVLVLCLNGFSDTGIIVGALNHPDRKTTLKDDEPHFEGEYNGVNIKVDSDGAATFTMKGATDNDGKVISSKGETSIKVEKDGSFQVQHANTTFRLDKTGKSILNTKGDVEIISALNIKAVATGDISMDGSGGKLKLSKEKVAIGGKDELLDLVDQALKKFSETLMAIQQMNVGTPVGPSSVPLNSAKFKQIQQEIDKIENKIIGIKGVL